MQTCRNAILALTLAVVGAACTHETAAPDGDPLAYCPEQTGVDVSARGACIDETRELRAAAERLGCQTEPDPLEAGRTPYDPWAERLAECEAIDEWVPVDAGLYLATVDAYRAAESCDALVDATVTREVCR